VKEVANYLENLSFVLSLDKLDLQVDFALHGSVSWAHGQRSPESCQIYLQGSITCTRPVTFEAFANFKWAKPQLDHLESQTMQWPN
jgi:hypothetical protein